ncbi:ribonuclease Y [bacterium]|nr:ribonuclease Y [bacterium]
MEYVIPVVIGLLVAAVGYFVAHNAGRSKADKLLADAEAKAQGMLTLAQSQVDDKLGQADKKVAQAEGRAQQIVSEAKSEASQRRKDADREIQKRQQDLERREAGFLKTEEKLADQLDKVEKRRTELDRRSQNLDKREQSMEKIEEEARIELERVAALDQESARAEVLRLVEDEARYEAASLRKRIEDEARSEATEIARKLIVKAVFRCAVDHYADSLITTVELKGEEMKGRIIGREGRNIRAIEAATGVDVIIDDTPNVVVLSSFDGVRREIARQSLERLIQDGRIHPAKIEEIVEASREAVEEEIWRAGQEAAFRLGITGLHPEIVKLVGRLKFRTSYGQNVLAHSIEVAILSGIIASELGLNPKNARRGGLLHDMGKAADAEMEGSHPEVGGRIARKFGENAIVVNCIEGHHGDVEQTIEAAIVQVADAISAVRPGARGEALQSYLSRLHELEKLATGFAGVERAYAISAGRELRVLVKPDEMDDVLTYDLCRQITKRIEDSMEYPGTIKVTVIRETRETGVAK